MGYCKCYEKGREEQHRLRLEVLSLEEDPKSWRILICKKKGTYPKLGLDTKALSRNAEVCLMGASEAFEQECNVIKSVLED